MHFVSFSVVVLLPSHCPVSLVVQGHQVRCSVAFAPNIMLVNCFKLLLSDFRIGNTEVSLRMLSAIITIEPAFFRYLVGVIVSVGLFRYELVNNVCR